MFRCNLQDLGSVISGDLEVPFFKNLRIRKALNLYPHFKYCSAGHVHQQRLTSPPPKMPQEHFSLSVIFTYRRPFSNDVIKNGLLMCCAHLPFSRAGAPV